MTTSGPVSSATGAPETAAGGQRWGERESEGAAEVKGTGTKIRADLAQNCIALERIYREFEVNCITYYGKSISGQNIRPFWLLCYRWFTHLHLALKGVQLPLPVLQWPKWTERTQIQIKQKTGQEGLIKVCYT